MSSQSGSEYGGNPKGNKNKKAKVQPAPQKRSRRSVRKNAQIQQNQNPLPENIPITESTSLITYSSFELQVTKQIIQVPLPLFKSSKMVKQTYTKVGETNLSIRVLNNQIGEVIVQSKVMQQQTKNSNGKKSKKSNNEQDFYIDKNNKKVSRIQLSDESQQQEQQEPEIVFLVWGKVCWIGNYQMNSKTIKQSPKILNSQVFIQIAKIKTKDVNSDVFIVLSLKRKIECVTEHNGLINQGNTCYMNSYLQMLSHISQFKNLVFEAPIQDQNKFPATLQALFYKLDNQQKPVSAEQLVKSFGWTKKQVNIQQDAQQFSCLFYQVLQKKLQQACPKPQHMSMTEMFEGNLINIIQCTKVGNVHILH